MEYSSRYCRERIKDREELLELETMEEGRLYVGWRSLFTRSEGVVTKKECCLQQRE